MSYKITITETRMVKKWAVREHMVIGQEERERDPKFCSGADEPKTRVFDVYGYTPDIEKILPETIELLTQVVEELDLAAVIKAVNGL